VVLDRSEASLASFFADRALHELSEHEQVLALRLLEMQPHAMLMYRSCGWFFDELSGIETVQVIQYAARAIQLAEQCYCEVLEREFLQHLAEAKSNLPEHWDGAQNYEKTVKPAFVDIERVAGHYSISSLFENYPDKTRIYCYELERDNYSLEAEGRMRLATGSVRLRSQITRESAALNFAVLHLGDHNVSAGVKPADSADVESHQKLKEAFSGADMVKAILAPNETFAKKTFSLRELFRDEQRKITNTILNQSLTSAAAVYRAIFESQAPLIRFLNGRSISVPKALMSAAEIALNSQLEQALERPELDVESIHGLLKEAAGSKLRSIPRLWNMRCDKGWRRRRRSLRRTRVGGTKYLLSRAGQGFRGKRMGAGGDPTMQQHFDNLVHLAEQLRIRAPQLELQP
jgi:alpha-amylase/alpha-mannosidase (GH57 family)